jgi:hypothetical protein
MPERVVFGALGRAVDARSGGLTMPDASRVRVVELEVVVYDRGPEPAWHEDRRLYGPWWRYKAEVSGYAAARELGSSPWEAVHRLVSNHRALLERRWSAEATSL